MAAHSDARSGSQAGRATREPRACAVAPWALVWYDEIMSAPTPPLIYVDVGLFAYSSHYILKLRQTPVRHD